MLNIFNRFIEFLYLRQEGNLVYYDSLTGLKSYEYYNRILRSKYRDLSCYVVFIDINNLKEVNDTEGHMSGNDLIIYVADSIRGLGYDVCRLSGDEFLILSRELIDIEKLSSIESISYGLYFKNCNETLSYAVSLADENMYNMKRALKR